MVALVADFSESAEYWLEQPEPASFDVAVDTVVTVESGAPVDTEAPVVDTEVPVEAAVPVEAEVPVDDTGQRPSRRTKPPWRQMRECEFS